MLQEKWFESDGTALTPEGKIPFSEHGSGTVEKGNSTGSEFPSGIYFFGRHY
jgi:hypothetical protein